MKKLGIIILNFNLIKLMFIETNPVPIKQLLFYAKLIKNNNVRLPLCEIEDVKTLELLNNTFNKKLNLNSSNFI